MPPGMQLGYRLEKQGEKFSRSGQTDTDVIIWEYEQVKDEFAI